MTSMQAEYSKVKEQIRHDQATEALAAGELSVKAGQLEETIRSNQAREFLTASELDEKIRHDLAVETETMREFDISQAEIERYHRAQEGQWRAENQLKQYIAEMNDSRERYLTAVNNDNRVEVTRIQEENRRNIARADRAATKAVNDARNTIEMFKANTSDAVAKAQINKMLQEVNVMSTYAANDTRRAMAAEKQAETASRNIDLAESKFEEEKYMNDWKMQVDKYYADLALTQQRIDGARTAVDSATKIFNSALEGVKTVVDIANPVSSFTKGKWKYTG